MRVFAGIGALVLAALLCACSLRAQSFSGLPTGPFATASSPASPQPPVDAASTPTASIAACSVNVTASASASATPAAPGGLVSERPKARCPDQPPRRDPPPPSPPPIEWRCPLMGCCGPWPQQGQPPLMPPIGAPIAAPIAAFCTNLPASGVPVPQAFDDGAVSQRLTEIERVLANMAKTSVMKFRVGFGSFFAEAADEASLSTISVLVAILAALAVAALLLISRLTAQLGHTITRLTDMLSAMAKHLNRVSAEGVEALTALAKAVSGVAAAIIGLTLVSLLVAVVYFFWSPSARDVSPGAPPVVTMPAPDSIAAADNALLATAIDALARAASADHASPGPSSQVLALLAGVAGVAFGIISVLAVQRLIAAQPQRAPAPVAPASEVIGPARSLPKARPLPYANPPADDFLKRLIELWTGQLEARLALLKSALTSAATTADAEQRASSSDSANESATRGWPQQAHDAASDLRRDVDELLRLTRASLDPTRER